MILTRPAALGPILVCALAMACSTVSGLDDLEFDLRHVTGTGGASGGASDGGAAGAGASAGAGGECATCDAPPDDCHESVGTCDGGVCVYAPTRTGSSCDDGDACTVGDTCDGDGSCVPGPVCPSEDPCLASTCTQGACQTADEPEGTSCGAMASLRCCGGACVDISTDETHCGGCSAACAAGKACESVEATSNCSAHPADTSGRCTCNATSLCPLGQICRTAQPYAGRCTPDTPAQCDDAFTDVNSCPNFCGY